LPSFYSGVFVIFEPLSTLAGALYAFTDPYGFVTTQDPSQSHLVDALKSQTLPLSSLAVAIQLGNCYLLLSLISTFILHTTNEVRTVRALLWALLLGDVGHVGACYWVLGSEVFWDVSRWNAVTAGNVGVTTLLAVCRIAYLLQYG
ncbi:hypothetical protein SAICODRAFT_46606, partial [Saitoella complicata NRRL Y-17804]